MPFRSQSQRRFLFAKHPAIAAEFAAHTPKGANLPEHVAKKKSKIPRVVRKYKAKIQKYKRQKHGANHWTKKESSAGD